MSSTDKTELSEGESNDDTLNDSHIDRSFTWSPREDVGGSSNNNQQSILLSISGDNLHRRNPLTVRQEGQSFDDLIPETSLADVQLNEMPGLQNTEQWKRIAARNIHASPPLSRQYYQTSTHISQPQDGQIPEVLGSYRRPGRTEYNQSPITITPSFLQKRRHKIIFGFSIIAIMIAIIVAVVVAVILVRRPSQIITDYYSGSIYVRARFDTILLSHSSTLAKNYQREFCSLISTALVDTKTKYAIFYSTCSVYNFRNGSIIGDFILGFTRYQNLTRLNAFLSRTLAKQQLFGGTILSITFNSTTGIDTNITDYDVDYDETKSVKSLTPEQDGFIFLTNEPNEKTLDNSLNLMYITSKKAPSSSEGFATTSTLSNTLPSPLTTDRSTQFDTSTANKRQKRILHYLSQDRLLSTEKESSIDQS